MIPVRIGVGRDELNEHCHMKGVHRLSDQQDIDVSLGPGWDSSGRSGLGRSRGRPDPGERDRPTPATQRPRARRGGAHDDRAHAHRT